MHSEGQLIHTPGYFFRNTDFVCPPNAVLGERRSDRNRLSANDSILVVRSDFHVQVADTEERLNEVSALIRRMYSWRGYRFDKPDSRPRPNHITLQACKGKDTLGTLSLNVDSEDGLLADDLYCREIDALRRRADTVCELTGFAVSSRLGSNELLATLFHLMHIMARHLHRVTDAVVEVNPRHAPYYQRLLGFNQIGDRKTCSRVNAPAVLLHIETDFIEEQIARHAACLEQTEKSLYPHFFSSHETEFLRRRMQELSQLFPASRRQYD
ncbi:MAG: long-chain N-acyl amino acid synthase [Propionivibrio sp.]|uniref:N-acyl amino acid synthase FeeM domain-containing protein n=1 Tax=Propionivibrio sp. TaxID=2212460 RepID=UPI001A5A2263|nr:long-chain N-acyl amino acid synthase [Propionivibrio sp.]MBL8414824.1 long-chain N-acyl amino acid synthase [Propionivibrio sp.]